MSSGTLNILNHTTTNQLTCQSLSTVNANKHRSAMTAIRVTPCSVYRDVLTSSEITSKHNLSTITCSAKYACYTDRLQSTVHNANSCCGSHQCHLPDDSIALKNSWHILRRLFDAWRNSSHINMQSLTHSFTNTAVIMLIAMVISCCCCCCATLRHSYTHTHRFATKSTAINF